MVAGRCGVYLHSSNLCTTLCFNIISECRFFYREFDQDNPFSENGELSRKADLIIQNSSFGAKNLKVVDPDLERGIGDRSPGPRFTDLTCQDVDAIQEESFPVVMRTLEVEDALTAEEVTLTKRRSKMKCCSVQ